MKFYIEKVTREGEGPYEGGSCKEAGVPPGKLYDDREEALRDAIKLFQANPVGFVVKETIPCKDCGEDTVPGQCAECYYLEVERNLD